MPDVPTYDELVAVIPNREQRLFFQHNRMRREHGMEPVTMWEWGLTYELCPILERPSGLHPGLIYVLRSTGRPEPMADPAWASVEFLRDLHRPHPGFIYERDIDDYDDDAQAAISWRPTARSSWTEVDFYGGGVASRRLLLESIVERAYGVAHYAIWRYNGDIYRLEDRAGPVPDGPIVTGREARLAISALV